MTNQTSPCMGKGQPKGVRCKHLLQKAGLSLSVFLLCVAVFEVVLRLNGYGSVEIYEPDPVLYWKLKPNQNCYTKVDHKPVHINSRGTRGAEFAVPKPPGTVRILSLGDSRTFGWGLTEAETYSQRLQQLLQQQAGSTNRIEVINGGVNAWSYSQMLAFFRETGLRWNPDIVVLGEANLWTQFTEKNSPEFVKQFMRRVRFKNFLRHFAIYHYVVEVKLKAYYERYRLKFIPVDPRTDTLAKAQQQSQPEQLFQSAIRDICELAHSNHVKPVLLYLPIADDMAGTNFMSDLQVKRQVSRQIDVPLVEVVLPASSAPRELYLDADPVHFNARGNELIARRLCEKIGGWVSGGGVVD